jgi:protein-S-isoprenylcysteine O-methyltransferase Ste14
LILSISGFSLRMFCFYTLGEFFTFNLGTRKNHTLIKTGPYAYILHPSYSAYILQIVSTFVFLSSCIFTYLFTCIIIAYSIFRVKNAIELEENVLSFHFKTDYSEFKKNKYRLIPFVY